MATLQWQVVNQTQGSFDVTTDIQSFNLTVGRSTPLAPYSGNSAAITMFSYGGAETTMQVNDQITIAVYNGVSYQTVFAGRVASRNFNDLPGTGVNSTMTVMLNDQMLQAGASNMQNQSLVSVNNQIVEIATIFPLVDIGADPTDVDMSVGTFTTNANQRINEIISGDRGVLVNNFGLAYYITPSNFDNYTTEVLTFGRTTSASEVAYQSLIRVEAASNSLFYNQATVTGSASTVTQTNLGNAFYYGVKSFSVTTAQSELVSDTAFWYANTFAEPETAMLYMTMNDYGQNATALNLLATFMAANQFVVVSYTPPGETAVTGYYWPEQMTVNATTSGTTIEFAMTPLTYYANFILNDAVFGVLDIDRLGV